MEDTIALWKCASRDALASAAPKLLLVIKFEVARIEVTVTVHRKYMIKLHTVRLYIWF